MMLPMMLPCCDFMMARQRALEANVSIATVKMFPEARCRRLPLRTAIANVPDSKPTLPARMWRIKSGSRMLPRPFNVARFNKERCCAQLLKQPLHLHLEKAVSFDTPLQL